MSVPRVSIVTVNFNGAAYLERTIRSVIDQGYSNLEYIIIDGGSTDGSVDIIKKYESSLAYWVSEPDSGMYDALQKGFARSTGVIMGWLNSDDVYHPRAIQNMARIFSRFPEIQWLTGVPSVIDEQDNITIPPVPSFPPWSKLRYYSFDFKWIQQESILWRRELWDTAGGNLNTSLKYAGDLELWTRFFRHQKLYVAPFHTGAFRVRASGQQSIQFKDKYLQEARHTIRREWLRISPLNLLLVILNFADAFWINMPLVNRVYIKIRFRRLLGYPPQIRFNPRTQDFELNG
jgi:glycosyltransferase involved in cell wall biosynthesis